jgi:hypothetical protein
MCYSACREGGPVWRPNFKAGYYHSRPAPSEIGQGTIEERLERPTEKETSQSSWWHLVLCPLRGLRGTGATACGVADRCRTVHEGVADLVPCEDVGRI